MSEDIAPYSVQLDLHGRGAVTAEPDAIPGTWIAEIDRTAYASGEAGVRVQVGTNGTGPTSTSRRPRVG